MQLNQATTDNPDQRISDDLNRFATIALHLSLGLLSSFVTLVSFSSILWTLSGALTIPLGGGAAIAIPGYMVFAALIYAVAGTMLTRWIGYPLIRLNFDQQRYEADFRFSMVRLRENAENVAFYGGEAREFDTFQTRFARVVANWWGIIKRRKKLTWFTYGYVQLAIVFPFLVAAPRYFDKAIQLGGLMQISSAFRQVQESLSFIISSYTEIAEYQSVVQRLAGFRDEDGRDRGRAGSAQPIEIERGGTGVEVDALDLNLPDGRSLRPNISAAATPGKPLLITGASGAGQEHVAACDRRAVAVRARPHSDGRRSLHCSCRSAPICRSAPWRTRSSIRGPPPSCRATASSRRCARSACRNWSTGSTRRGTGRSASRSASSSGSPLRGCCWPARRSSFSTRRPRRSTRPRKYRYTGCCVTRRGGRRSSASAITAPCGVSTTRSSISRRQPGFAGGGRMQWEEPR